MFQSSSTASGISRLHSSIACWPSSASLILISSPSRMRRATLRMTLESSTTKQVFIAAYSHHSRALAHPIGFTIASCGKGIASHFEHAIDVEDHHELSFEAMHAARHAREVLVEVDRIGLARPVGELEHFAYRVDQQPVGLGPELDADRHRRPAVYARRQAEPAPHVDRGNDAAAQVEHAGDLGR